MKKILIILGLFFIGFVSAAITVTLPVEAPTGITATLQAGGSLTINHTYYMIMFVYDSYYTCPSAQIANRRPHHSPISEEVNITTNDTHRQFRLDWNDVTNGMAYNAIVSNASNDYVSYFTECAFFEDNRDCPTDNSSGLVVSTAATILTKYKKHSIQLKNNLTANLNKELGIIKIEITGTDDYVYYDGYYFVLKGSFFFTGTGAGSLVIEKKMVILVKGFITIDNPNVEVRFGRWNSEEAGSYDIYSSNLDIQNCRSPIDGVPNFYFYGGIISKAKTLNSTGETLDWMWYYGGSQQFLALYISGIREAHLEMNGRSNLGIVRDLKFISDYWAGTAMMDLWVPSGVGYLHTGPTEGFYRVRFSREVYSYSIYHYPESSINYTRYFYDCIYPINDDGLAMLRTSNLKEAEGYVDYSVTEQWYTINLKVVDEDGDSLEDVLVSIIDKDGSEINLKYKNNSNDGRVNGTLTTLQSTDVNGTYEYYVLSYNISHLNGDSSQYVNNLSFATPFNITLSKENYEEYSFTYNQNLTEPIEWIIALLDEIPDTLIIYVQGVILNDKVEFPYFEPEGTSNDGVILTKLERPYINK